MSDDLVKRLRSSLSILAQEEAADRIEELEARLEVYEGTKGHPVSCSGIVADMAGDMQAMRSRIEQESE